MTRDEYLFRHCLTLIYGAHSELLRIINENPTIHSDLGFPRLRIEKLRMDAIAIVEAGDEVYSTEWNEMRDTVLAVETNQEGN